MSMIGKRNGLWRSIRFKNTLKAKAATVWEVQYITCSQRQMFHDPVLFGGVLHDWYSFISQVVQHLCACEKDCMRCAFLCTTPQLAVLHLLETEPW